MTCSNCHQTIEEGAAFCGNCGQAVQIPSTPMPTAPPPISPIAQVISQPPVPGNGTPLSQPLAAANGVAVPAYALAKPGQHTGQTKALLALLFGLTGIVGSLFLVPIGLALGMAGIIMGTMSRSSPKRGLSTAGLVFSIIAVLVSLGLVTYAIVHDPRFNQDASSATTTNGIAAPAAKTSDISTPCYSAGFVDKLNVSNSSDSCDMSAFNGPTIAGSTNAYKVYAETSPIVNSQNYTGIFKAALEKDVKASLPGFAVDSEQSVSFAGSPAYTVNASNKAQDVAVIEAAVMHKVGTGQNVFILVHAINGKTTDLSTLEAEWQWK
jgi:hypothetical protein